MIFCEHFEREILLFISNHIMMGNLNEDYEKSSLGDSKNIFNENDIFIRKIIESDYKRGFEILFRMYYSRLCNHANRFVYSKEISEDIVMEVFKGIWENNLFDKVYGPYKAYLYRSVRNRAITYLKNEVCFDTLNEIHSEKIESHEESPDEIISTLELANKIELAINSLPFKCKNAFILSRKEGKKYIEIAEELNITVSAVERLINRALTKLKKVIYFFGFILYYLKPLIE